MDLGPLASRAVREHTSRVGKPLGGDLFLLAWESTKALEGGGWPEVWGVPELVVSGLEGGVGRGLGHGDRAKLPALRCWVVGPGLGWGKRGRLLTPGWAPVKHDFQCIVHCAGLPYSPRQPCCSGLPGERRSSNTLCFISPCMKSFRDQGCSIRDPVSPSVGRGLSSLAQVLE